MSFIRSNPKPERKVGRTNSINWVGIRKPGRRIRHFSIGKNEIQPEPKALTIWIGKERQNNCPTETQTEQPIQTDPPKDPNHEQGNDPKSANQSIADGNASYEKTVLPAVFKITGRALVMAVKKILKNTPLSTSRAAITDGAE